MKNRIAGDHPAIFRIDVTHDSAHQPTPELVGGKGYGLWRMVSAGIRVPPGFVLGTACSREFFRQDSRLPDSMAGEIEKEIRVLEKSTSKIFGSRRNPLLVSVRSGAPVSMPGMMETLLNVGLNDDTVHGLIRASGNPRLAWDSYRRLIQSTAEVVFGAEPEEFEELIKKYLKRDGLRSISELSSVDLRNLCADFKSAFRNGTGKDFPADPWKQLHNAVVAVFNSWFSKRAEKYRAINEISAESGTACVIQTMVFGNAGGTSGSGVGFTRNPANGANELYVDYLANAQGEDIVSGRHDVQDVASLQQRFPDLFERLNGIKARLEKEFHDMQDFEFTVENGDLYLLQTRNGKRTPMAALRVAIDLFDEHLITSQEALAMLGELDFDRLVECHLTKAPAEQPIASGTTASTGVVAGLLALDENKAKQYSEAGKAVILVRPESSTEDIGAMHLASGVVTVTGGRTSHAAVVARQLGIACIVGCHAIRVDMNERCIRIDGLRVDEGEFLTLDAEHGLLYAGCLDIEMRKPESLLQRVREWREKEAAEPRSLSPADA